MIKDLKELEALLTLCRKQGVTELTIGDCSLKLGELPPPKSRKKHKDEAFTSDELTDEQLMFYSAGGPPLGDDL
jgi:hypothetical protein